MYKKIVNIPSGKSVAPGSTILSSAWNEIEKIHIVKEIKGKITIYTGVSTVTYEPGAFIQGGVYEINVHKITYELDEDEHAILGLTSKKK